MLDVMRLRRDFPILSQKTGIGAAYAYLDNAATTQKPLAVLESMDQFYREKNANVHRAMHELSERATVAYEDARKTVQHFVHAKHAEEIIFTKNATEAINLVARSWGHANLKTGDVIVLSLLEHHSNIVPWQQLAKERGCEIAWLEIDEAGTILSLIHI